MVQKRYRGHVVIGRNTLQDTPTFGTITNSCDVYTVPITLGEQQRISSATWIVTDSAGVLHTGLTGASGDSGTTVVPNSTTNYASGTVLSTTTGYAGIILTSTGTSTARLIVGTASGQITTGTPFAFT